MSSLDRLKELLRQLVALGRKSGYIDSRPAAREDHDFIENDELVRELISLMAEFGKGGRYASLDAFIDSDFAWNDPKDKFHEIENLVIDRHPGWFEELTSASGGERWADVYREMTAALQRVARAIVRYLTLGPAQDSGRFLTWHIGPFLNLMDHELSTPTLPWYQRR